MTRWRVFSSAVPFVLVSACGQVAEHELVFTGSSTVVPVMTELAAAYEARNEGWRIDVQSGSRRRGIRDPRQGLAEAGMISRVLAWGTFCRVLWPETRGAGLGGICH